MIGLIDNVLRPILVGKDTQMPDYVVLISTVGGLALIGINGFVIGPLIAAMFMTAWQILAAERAAPMPRRRIAHERNRCLRAVGALLPGAGRFSVVRARAAALARCVRFRPSLLDAMEDASERIRELEARLVAHGLVLKTIARLLSESTLAELKAAAQGIDDEGMQEANPNLHMRRVAEEIWSILEMVG